MGVLSQGILGPVRNKIGPVVGFVWKGIPALRSYNDSPSNPQTAAQVANRTKWSFMVAYAKVLLVPFIKPLWDRFASKMSGYNAWIKANAFNFDDTGIIDLTAVVLSQGSLTEVTPTTMSGTNGAANVDVNWTANTGTGTALASDEMYIAVYNETNGEWGAISGTVLRSAGTAAVIMPANQTTGDVLHAYIATRRADGTLVTNTGYLTDTV